MRFIDFLKSEESTFYDERTFYLRKEVEGREILYRSKGNSFMEAIRNEWQVVYRMGNSLCSTCFTEKEKEEIRKSGFEILEPKELTEKAKEVLGKVFLDRIEKEGLPELLPSLDESLLLSLVKKGPFIHRDLYEDLQNGTPHLPLYLELFYEGDRILVERLDKWILKNPKIYEEEKKKIKIQRTLAKRKINK